MGEIGINLSCSPKGKNNAGYWIREIERNRQRDRENEKKLLFLEWNVVRFRGKDIMQDVGECVKVVEEMVLNMRT